MFVLVGFISNGIKGLDTLKRRRSLPKSLIVIRLSRMLQSTGYILSLALIHYHYCIQQSLKTIHKDLIPYWIATIVALPLYFYRERSGLHTFSLLSTSCYVLWGTQQSTLVLLLCRISMSGRLNIWDIRPSQSSTLSATCPSNCSFLSTSTPLKPILYKNVPSMNSTWQQRSGSFSSFQPIWLLFSSFSSSFSSFPSFWLFFPLYPLALQVSPALVSKNMEIRTNPSF